MTPKTTLALMAKNLEIFYYKVTNQQQRIIPYKVLVEVTNRCNSKCLHCDIWKIEKHAHTQVDLGSMERFLQKMQGKLLWLALSGGEVSLYKEFPSLVALIKKHNPGLRIMTFTTNGLLPQKILQYALLIRQELKSDVFITISLDGDEETHDEVRGVKGNYRKAQETYDLLKANGIQCHYGITVSPTNASFIHTQFRKFRDSIKAVTFMHTEGIFLTDQAQQNDADDRQIEQALQHIHKNYKVDSLGEVLVKLSVKMGIRFLQKGRKTNVVPCDVGLSSVHLMSNGDLLPCMYLPAIENINQEGFELSAFHNEKALNMRKDIKNDHCPHCWMNCYAPHNMLQSPLKSALHWAKPL